ncbi:hypothetical protein BCVP_CDS0019 [Bacillus phage BC-VP]|nr:hypothetical protein BCVP_CDS0019 [Bacillus phage BC-VP]
MNSHKPYTVDFIDLYGLVSHSWRLILPSLTYTTVTFERIRTLNLSTFEHLALSFYTLLYPSSEGTIICISPILAIAF